MLQLKFVRITPEHTSEDMFQVLADRHNAYLGGNNLIGSLSIGSIERHFMREIVSRGKVIILLNQNCKSDIPEQVLREGSPFSFRTLHKNGRGSSIVTEDEALREGNYFLCIDRERFNQGKSDLDITPGIYGENKVPERVHEYKCHIDPAKAFVWRTRRPAYVNLDRSTDSIGGSSWDGNLVSWMGCGFGTRMQYGVQSGLFPDEE